MKHIAKKIAILALSGLAANQAVATAPELCPYVGLEAQANWTGLKSEWKNYLAKSQIGANAFIGGRVMENLGFELGYNWSPRKHKPAVTLPASLAAIGTTPVAGAKAASKIGIRGWYVDANWYAPIEENDLIVSLGAAWRKASITWHAPNNTAVEKLLNSNTTGIRGDKYKVVIRAGLGMQTMINDNFGVRGMVRWENVSKLRVRNTTLVKALKFSHHPIRDGFGLTLAGFYQF